MAAQLIAFSQSLRPNEIFSTIFLELNDERSTQI
jgi:hypothetical protein